MIKFHSSRNIFISFQSSLNKITKHQNSGSKKVIYLKIIYPHIHIIVVVILKGESNELLMIMNADKSFLFVTLNINFSNSYEYLLFFL